MQLQEPDRAGPGPWPRALVAMSYFFLVMACFYVLKPLRESYFLDTQEVTSFLKVHIIVCAATFLAVMLFDSATRRWRAGWLATWSGPFFAAQIVAFALCMRSGLMGTVLPWLYYVWVSVFSVFAPALFWSLTHNAFTNDEGKRHYGLVGAGGILGGMAGSELTHLLAHTLSRDGLLGVAALLLLPVALPGWLLDRWRVPARRATDLPPPAGYAWEFLRQSYIFRIALVMFLTMLAAEYADHQTQRVLKSSGMQQADLTAWYGRMYFAVNVMGVSLNLLVARFILKRWGPGPGLYALQLAVIVKATALAVSPLASTVMWALALDLGIHYSLFQSSKELLYVPTSPEVKFRAKTLIDTFVFRLGIALGAVTTLFFLAEAPLPMLSGLVIFVSLVCLGVCRQLAGQYRSLSRRV